jgi:carbonic anhydrase/acetyltransferase-like protein (isoleucine patch superfamily)
MKKPLYIIGCGGFGRSLAMVVRRSEEYYPAGFYDDAATPGQEVLQIPVLGAVEALATSGSDQEVLLGVGNPAVKEKLWSRLHPSGHIHFPIFIAPGALVLDPVHTAIGQGAILMPQTIVDPGVQIGRGCLLHFGCLISHDTVIGDFSSLMQGVIVPSGAQISKNSIVPAGTVVVEWLGG